LYFYLIFFAIEAASMTEKRFHFVGMPSSPYQNSSHKFFVLGGGVEG